MLTNQPQPFPLWIDQLTLLRKKSEKSVQSVKIRASEKRLHSHVNPQIPVQTINTLYQSSLLNPQNMFCPNTPANMRLYNLLKATVDTIQLEKFGLISIHRMWYH